MKSKTVNKEAVEGLKTDASKPVEDKSQIDLSNETPHFDEGEGEELDDYEEMKADDKIQPLTILDRNGNQTPIIYDIDKYRISKNKGIEIVKLIQKEDTKSGKLVEDIIFIPLISTPISPIKVYHNKDTKEIYVLVGWIDGYQVKEHKLPMDKLLTRRGVQELSKYGVNFTDRQAGDMAAYFSHILEYNKHLIPVVETYNTMGWKDNFTSFVIGRKKIYVDDNKKVQAIDVEINANYSVIDGLTRKGDVKTWLDSTRPLLKYNSTRFSCYAVIASFVLPILNEQSRMIIRWFESSSGKSTIHDAAMSQIGSPKVLNLTGSGTATGVEEMLSFLNNVPANFDDLQSADPDFKKQLAYLIGNEKGKLRGKKEGGMREILTWCSVVLCSSETPLLENNTTTGAKVRAYEIYGGLGARDKVAVDKFRNDIFKAELSYGHLTPYIVSIILNSKPLIREKYRDAIVLLNDTLDKVAQSQSLQEQQRDSIGERIINSFAVFLVAGWVFELIMKELGEATVKPEDVIVEAMKDVINNTVNKPYHIQALHYIYDWIRENSKGFTIDGEYQEKMIPTKIYGDLTDSSHINIHNKTIAFELKSGGFDFNRIKKDWELYKIIEDNKNVKDNRFYVGKEQGRGISINTAIVKALTGEDCPIAFRTKVQREEDDISKDVAVQESDETLKLRKGLSLSS